MGFSDITVVGIHGNGGIEREIPAVLNNLKALPGSKGLLVTDKLVSTDIPQKLVHQSMGYMEFQDFLIYGLFQYIDTEFALITQSDGWILNPDNWQDDFFNYDFIGGATHAAFCPESSLFKMYYTWIGEKNPVIVQNGGFSLRSRRFLEAPTKYGIVKKYVTEPLLYNEDIQLCCWMRPALESVGMRFAPSEVSMHFSFEHLSPYFHKDLDLKKVFGHHSRFRRLTGEKKMTWSMPDQLMKQIDMEDQVYALFEHYGYEICKESEPKPS